MVETQMFSFDGETAGHLLSWEKSGSFEVWMLWLWWVEPTIRFNFFRKGGIGSVFWQAISRPSLRLQSDSRCWSVSTGLLVDTQLFPTSGFTTRNLITELSSVLRSATELPFISRCRHKDNSNKSWRDSVAFALTAALPGFNSQCCRGPGAESLELTLVSGNAKCQTLTCQWNLNLLSFLNGPLGLWRTQADYCLLRHGNSSVHGRARYRGCLANLLNYSSS